MGLALWQPIQDWEAAGHRIHAVWLEVVGRYGATAVLLLLALACVVAWRRRNRYRAVEAFGPDHRIAVHDALVAAEKRTVGEIVPVVLERSDSHPAGALVAGLFTFLVGCALLATWLPWDRPLLLVPLQLLLGGVGWLAARLLPDFHRRFVRESRATEMAEEQALQEFFRQGLHETEGRTGVLIFVSLFERRAVVLADKGISEVVPEGFWDEVNRTLLEGVRKGSLSEGLVAGIAKTGDALAEHFPWKEGDRNEIPDRLIVRRE